MKKKIFNTIGQRFFTVALIAIAIAVAFTACSKDGGGVPATGVTVEPKTKTLNIGDTFTPTATVQPAEANQAVT
jgi:uncharacterized protein YjdB